MFFFSSYFPICLLLCLDSIFFCKLNQPHHPSLDHGGPLYISFLLCRLLLPLPLGHTYLMLFLHPLHFCTSQCRFCTVSCTFRLHSLHFHCLDQTVSLVLYFPSRLPLLPFFCSSHRCGFGLESSKLHSTFLIICVYVEHHLHDVILNLVKGLIALRLAFSLELLGELLGIGSRAFACKSQY